MGCGASNAEAATPPEAKKANVTAIPTTSISPKRKLHVVHFNDIYNMEPTSSDPDAFGGLARFSAKLHEMREADPNLMVVFGGDFLAPSMTSGLTKGKHMVDMLNEVRVSASQCQHHERSW